MIHRHSPGSTRQLTLGADKVSTRPGLSPICVTPHFRADVATSSDRRPHTRHKGHAQPIEQSKRIAEALAKPELSASWPEPSTRGMERVHCRFILTMAANNLPRLIRLPAAEG